ncbi:MAG: SPOR domain-containing protein, partial [Thiotrichaceae bacterium]|nr:SPOR domain-containing protein [Thiotrichaceae bacterium]
LLNQQKKPFSSSSFKVIAPQQQGLKSTSKLHNENWLLQQENEHYTLQLFGSRSKNAITELINRYSLSGDIARFETQKDGKSWFSMTYGMYQSRAEATQAIAGLNPKLTSPAPWIRSFAGIKKQIQQFKKTPSISKKVAGKQNSIRNDAWIWTQNPADYTLQLVTLSTEQAIKDFAHQHKIEPQSTQFSIKSNNKKHYVLLYGVYSDKTTATEAKQKIVLKIPSIKPWLRSFSDIHELMSSQNQ